jgi:hypothetical protein
MAGLNTHTAMQPGSPLAREVALSLVMTEPPSSGLVHVRLRG